MGNVHQAFKLHLVRCLETKQKINKQLQSNQGICKGQFQDSSNSQLVTAIIIIVIKFILLLNFLKMIQWQIQGVPRVPWNPLLALVVTGSYGSLTFKITLLFYTVTINKTILI